MKICKTCMQHNEYGLADFFIDNQPDINITKGNICCLLEKIHKNLSNKSEKLS